MKVTLRTGYFGNRQYQVHWDATALQFICEEEVLQIPMHTIRRITLSGRASFPDNFTMDTDIGVYQGYIGSERDASEFIEMFSKRTGGAVEVQLINQQDGGHGHEGNQ